MPDLNEEVRVTVSDANVVTVPIDTTLSNSGEAADAKAVGDALALKADKSELQNAVTVNGQAADAQGAIIVTAADTAMSDEDPTTIQDAVEAAMERTGADIPISAEPGADTIQEAVTALTGKTAQNIPMSNAADAMTISGKIAAMDQTDVDLADAVQTVNGKTAADIAMGAEDATKISEAIAGRLRSVNGVLGDEDGNVQVEDVPFADNLRSSLSQNTVGTFSLRTAGGAASIEDGDAWLTGIRGNRIHTGYVPETLNMTVSPVEREEGEDTITAEIDRDTFVAYVEGSTTVTLNYLGGWSESPTLYGITVTGTPKNGDVIVVFYTKENRGTITQSTPAAFIATGWNLYNHAAGYARAVKYSNSYGFKVGGTYSAVKFSTTIDGPKSAITPVDGYFNISANGYIWIEGGNATDTEVYMTWSDWQDPSEHPAWEAYAEYEIDMSDIMSSYFPYGLMRVGDVRDEINLNAGIAISNVERLAYNAENLAAAIASGRAWEADTNYIYLELAAPVTSEIYLDGGYAASDHGIEYFTGTTVPVYAIILYGNNLKNKLERDVLTKSAQALESSEKAQARTNIGAASQADLDTLSDQIATKASSLTNVYYRKSGNTVQVDWKNASNIQGTSNSWVTLDTLPEGYRPNNGINFCGYDNADDSLVMLRIATDGYVQAYYKNRTTMQPRFCITFIIS